MKIWTVIAITWITTAVAVSLAVYITKDATPLWGMIIPALVSYKHE